MSVQYTGWISLHKDYQSPVKTFTAETFESIKMFFIENQVPESMLYGNVRYFDAVIGGTANFISIHTVIKDAENYEIESEEIISHINSYIRYFGIYGSITKCFKESVVDELLNILTRGDSSNIVNPFFEKKVIYLWDEANALHNNNNIATMHHLIELILQHAPLRTKLLKQAEGHPYFVVRMENNKKAGEYSFESLTELKEELQEQGVPADIINNNSRYFNYDDGGVQVSYKVEIDFT